MDKIRIGGIRCLCRIGVPDAERRKPQTIYADLEMEADLEKAGRTDDMRWAPDYEALEKSVRASAQKRPRRLLENLARDLALRALAFDPRIKAVSVTVRKKPAAMPKSVEVAVTLRRARPT